MFLTHTNIIKIYANLHKIKQHDVLIAGLAITVIGGVLAFPLSYIAKSNTLVGFWLLPFVLSVQGKSRVNYGYLAFILFFGILAYTYHVRIFYFFTLGFYVISLLEWCAGKVSLLVLFLIGFMSPFFEQVAVVMGFPLRLQLSQWAGGLLSFAGMDVRVEGNMMLLQGADFTVDEACMGLHLLSISMLMGVFIMGHRYRMANRKLGLAKLTAFFLFAFLLNVVSNLFRIMMLVVFRVLPDNPMHEVIGILCLVVYIMPPLYLLSRWMIDRYGDPILPGSGQLTLNPFAKTGMIAVACVVLWLGFQVSRERSRTVLSHASVSLQNFQPVKIDNGITKMFDRHILVYVKPIPEFFTGEHTPLFCWKGSGYHFKSIRKTVISGHEIYTGQLVKPGVLLYTAWWYSNGKVQTIDQMDWRMRMLKGEADFCLINVTASDEAILYTRLTAILEKDLLTIQENK